MRTERVIVVPYNYKWNDEFQKIKLHLEEKLRNEVVTIEHVGSTSVKGLSAKPIIDVDIVIENYDKFPYIKYRLETLGYYHEGNLGIKDREAFGYNEKPNFMTHHIYVCPQYSEELRKHIAFRDYLRLNKVAREKYSEIKLEAAKRYPTNIQDYIEFKSPFINNIYTKLNY